MEIIQAQNSVLHAGLRLVETGLIARTWGNVSCRVDAESFVITPSGRSYQSLTANDLVQVKIDDLSFKGSIKPSSEKGVHAEVYKLYPEVNFVIHTHQENASVIAATALKAIPVGGANSMLGEEVLCADYALPGTRALRKNVRRVLMQSRGQAVIMKHYGALCFGRDAEEAFAMAIALEKVCADHVINQYLKLSGGKAYDPYALAAFALGQKKAALSNRLQSEGKPASERREKLGQNGMDGAKEGAIIDEQRIAERLAEAGLYQTIYQRNPQINAIIFKASPELQCLSRAGVGLKPLLDDFAQIVGLQVRTFDQKEPDRIARALRKSAAVLIKDSGALCCGVSEDDAKAVAMILQKNANALIGAVLFGKVQPINAFESMLMRFVYLKKYAKQAFVSGTESRRQ
ncbi:MAG: hypothetical protein GX050_01030 [Firmicutes bacterium]|nr:hypothetical protein [Bacillota bacterium]